MLLRKFTTTTQRAVDLTYVHKLAGKLFPQPKTTKEWSKYALSQEQCDQFHVDGFLPGIKVANEEQVETLRQELELLYDRDHPDFAKWYAFDCDCPTEDPRDNLFHSLGAWRLSHAFHDIIWSPQIRMAAYQLLGGHSFSLLHDQLFCKPASDGGVVAWHQDFSYWTWTKPRAHLTCWIGLDDVDESNGCLWYVPGSHRWGLLPMTGLAGSDMDTVKQVLDTEQQRQLNENKEAAVLSAGYATLHHPLMMHGSYGNASTRQRRATVVNMMREGVVSNCEGRDMGGFPSLPNGKEMSSHACYPRLVNEVEMVLMEEACGGVRNGEASVELDMEEFVRDMSELRHRERLTEYKHLH